MLLSLSVVKEAWLRCMAKRMSLQNEVMTAKLATLYHDHIRKGELVADPAQEEVLAALQQLNEALAAWQRTGLLGRLLKHTKAPKGLYIYGSVGRGKSFLMDLFFTHAAVTAKRRVHFHQFMLEVHDYLNKWREKEDHGTDPLPIVAAALAKQTRLLCFDEFHVADIADAMILSRLFAALFAEGVVVVATSNWAPEDLYKDGLQRQRFVPFIDILRAHMTVVAMGGKTDHRQQRLQGQAAWLTPVTTENKHKLETLFTDLTHHATPEPVTLTVLQRALVISRAAAGVAWFGFAELCSANLGPADYLAIATCFHTVLLEGVPPLGGERSNETIRFVLLIDALYEAKTKLFATADLPPEALYVTGPHAATFARTASRLAEMQSDTYRRLPHLAH